MLILGALDCVPLIYVSVFMPVLYCFDYHSLKYSLKSGSMISPALFFFLKIALAIWGSFVVLYKFYDFLFYFYEKCHWNFDMGCTEPVDCFG